MKRNKFKSFFVLLLALCCIAIPVKAEELVTTTGVKNTVEDKAYFYADDTADVNNTVYGSSFIAGNNVTVNGKVDGALFAAGNVVKHSGSASYAAIAGNSIEISGVYEKDVAIAGNIVSVRGETVFGRDVVIAASEVTLSGVINRDIAIYAEKVNLENAKINGTAKIMASKIEVGGETLIKGNFKSNLDIDKKYVEGEIIHLETTDLDLDINVSYKTVLLTEIIGFISLLVTFVVLYLVAPKLFESTSKMEFTFGKWLSLFMSGLILLVFLPIISLFVMITVIGIPVSLVALALYFIAIYVSHIFTGLYLGQYLWENVFKKEKNALIATLIGTSAIFLVSLIPYIGTFVEIVSLLVGLGLIINILKKK